MNKDIAEPRDVLPRNSGYCLSHLVANPLRRLPDQMKVANDRVLNDRPRMERVSTGSGLAFYPAYAVEDMLQVLPVPFRHNGSASRKIRSRILGCRDDSVTTSTFRSRISSRAACKPPGKKGGLWGPQSTRKSKSLSGRSSPRAFEPKMRRLAPPWRRAASRSSCRFESNTGFDSATSA